MKILMTSSGGIIRDMNTPEYGLASELVRRGHEVTVLSSSSVLRKHAAKKEEVVEGIKVKRFSPVLPSSLLYMLRNNFDLVHMHHLGYLAPISSFAALRKKIKSVPAIFTIHGLYHDPYLVKNPEDPFSENIQRKVQTSFSLAPWKIFNWFVHLPLGADKITALTEWEKIETAKLGIRKDKIEVIPNGVNLEKYKKRKKDYFKKLGLDGNILLFVGQPAKRKGWQYFLQAMPRMLKEFPDVKAVFIGYRQSQELEDMCEKLGIRDAVRFLGFLPEEEKIQALQSADAFVFPTLYEGFGIVFLEAMACGLPIITTHVAGNSEIVEHKKNGLLVMPKDSAAISDAVIELLTNKQLRSRIRKNDLEKVKGYDWKHVAKSYQKIYESVM